MVIQVGKEWNYQFGQKTLTNPVETIYIPTINPTVKPMADQDSIQRDSMDLVCTQILLLNGCMVIRLVTDQKLVISFINFQLIETQISARKPRRLFKLGIFLLNDISKVILSYLPIFLNDIIP